MAKEKAKKEKKKSSFWKDFKAFISRGNIVDLAVAVVVGAAFTAIVNSLVNDIIKPLITLLFGGEDMSDLVVVLRTIVDPDTNEIVDTITLNYGNLIMAILTFLIDAFVIFTVLRIVRNAQRKLKEGAEALKQKMTKDGASEEEAQPVADAAAPAVPAEPPKPTTEELLAEIRDLLKENAELKKTAVVSAEADNVAERPAQE